MKKLKEILEGTCIFRLYLRIAIWRKVHSAFLHEQREFASQNMDVRSSRVGESARLAAMYHVIEKGLTMPNRRLGFGQTMVIALTKRIIAFYEKYGEECAESRHAIAVLLEYYKLHEREQFELELATKDALEKCLKGYGIEASQQKQVTAEEYWRNNMADFAAFSSSRHSVRHYSDGIVPFETIKSAVSLANNAPSACNRQPCKVYCVQDAEKKTKLLHIQGGNRGFGHLADKVLVVTCDRQAFMPNEPFSVHVNGGIYLMNLAYALHFYKIAHCILTWVPTAENDILAHKLLGIESTEAIIAIMTCGVLPREMMLAASPRKSVDETLALI